MAEVAGVALGPISMAALFNNALECFHLVRIGKAFGEDYDTFQIRISLLQLRLSQWGEAAGLDKAKEGDLLPFPESAKKAREALAQVTALLDKANSKVGGRDRQASDSQFTENVRAVCEKVRDMSISRTNKAKPPTFLTKTNWALTGREEVLGLVDSISGLLNDFIPAFSADRVIRSRSEACQKDAKVLAKQDPGAVDHLKRAMGESDEELREALEQATSSVTHNNTVSFAGESNKGVQVSQNYGTQTNHFGT